MTDYETIMVFLGILALLVSFGTLPIALLAYIDRNFIKIHQFTTFINEILVAQSVVLKHS